MAVLEASESGKRHSAKSETEEAPPGPSINTILTDRLPFNIFVATCVILNTVVIGLEQDLAPKTPGIAGKEMWWLLNCLFIIAFAVELIIRMYVEMSAFFEDLVNLLDVALVVAAGVDCFLLWPAGSGGAVRLFTVLRTLRILRLVKLVRMFPAFRELWLLVGGFVNSLKALAWVSMVVILVLYVCSVLVTTEIGQNDATYGIGPSYDGEVWPYKEYFGTIFRSMFTLFQVLTLDGWCDDIVRHIVHRQPIMAIFFILFVMVTAFGIINVVVGIIVDNTLVAAQVADTRVEQLQAYNRKKAIERLMDTLLKSDVKRSGEISKSELKAAVQSRVVQKLFDTIGIKWSEALEIYELLDHEKSGSVELKRFGASLRELVGGARRRDIVHMEITVGTLSQRLDFLDQKFSAIEEDVTILQNVAEEFMNRTVRLLTGHANFDDSEG